ncbi:hypothetical protein [Dyadobacter arcticus]|uniref:Mg/Co/Ni transporter MgtE n=1 Tax=Dyadobacter arcticus TaxID=1078754 RepID=A0ABX0UKA1_9BACT|nr:hypothetical protein [Dyadobacter arcticus]NIJ53448.1 Mg/Co/Ni transporter MgtE [Dyadobacter arcticus]
MEKHLNLQLPLSFRQLTDLVRQLPRQEREKLVSVLQKEMQRSDEPTKAQILKDLKQDYIALQKGELKTRPLKDILDEL